MVATKDFNTCTICQGQIKFLYKIDKYEIYKCESCGLGITKNSTTQSSDYHRDSVYEIESDQFKNIFQRRVNFIKSLNIEAGKVLEIGSSTGLMLSLLKEKGWEVLGVEISQEAANFAIKRGINTLTTPIEDINLPQQSFDLIIMNHTLEHLENPNKVIQKISSLLKVEGILILDVPNFDSLSSKIFKKRWFALLPAEHLWHFTFPSLSKLLQSSGFKVLRRTSPSGIWDYGNPLLEVFQSLLGMKKRFLNNVLTAVPNLAVTLLNEGSTLTVVARKVNR